MILYFHESQNLIPDLKKIYILLGYIEKYSLNPKYKSLNPMPDENVYNYRHGVYTSSNNSTYTYLSNMDNLVTY